MLEHRTAQLTAACTFLLLIIGGMVNPTGSSLACPEATIICHGEILPEMTGGVLYEHGHRLAAMTVGFLQIALTVMLLVRRRGMAGWAIGTLVMVIVQGGLGAITVAAKLPWYVSTAHLLLAFSYFATLIYVAWRTAPARPSHPPIGSARRWIQLAVVVVFVQLLLGALVRHSEAALACVGMPECTVGGEWLPAALTQRVHMIHRAWGVVVALVTTVAAVQVWRHAEGWTWLRRLMLAAPVLVLAQVVLGIYVVLTFRSVPVAVAHFAGAASLWALWFSAWLMTGSRHRAAADHPELAPVPGVHAVP
jgi:cytochrome c oxidase assembly protein subunit 15